MMPTSQSVEQFAEIEEAREVLDPEDMEEAQREIEHIQRTKATLRNSVMITVQSRRL